GLFPSARGGRCVLPIGDRAVRGGALRAARGGGAVRPAGGGGGGGGEARARGSRLVERAGRGELGERGVGRVAEAAGRRGTAAPAVATSELGGDRQGRATADVSEPGRVRLLLAVAHEGEDAVGGRCRGHRHALQGAGDPPRPDPVAGEGVVVRRGEL